MQIKTITYQRVLNLGNYESKRLEMTAELLETDDPEAEASHLMELVERKIRDEVEKPIIEQIKLARRTLRELKEEIAKKENPGIDDIPFKPGDAASGSSIPDGF